MRCRWYRAPVMAIAVRLFPVPIRYISIKRAQPKPGLMVDMGITCLSFSRSRVPCSAQTARGGQQGCRGRCCAYPRPGDGPLHPASRACRATFPRSDGVRAGPAVWDRSCLRLCRAVPDPFGSLTPAHRRVDSWGCLGGCTHASCWHSRRRDALCSRS